LKPQVQFLQLQHLQQRKQLVLVLPMLLVLLLLLLLVRLLQEACHAAVLWWALAVHLAPQTRPVPSQT
jgi:hypothetical protein